MSLPPLGLAELAKRTDDLMKADLLYWRDFWFDWLIWSTAFVVAGLCCEGPELIHEIKSIRCKYATNRFTISLNELHSPDWVKVFAFFGWLLIVVGVAGELVTTVMVSRADTSVQAFNDALLAETSKEAGIAKSSAEAAAAASSRADVAASKAQQESDAVAKTADDLLQKYVRAENEVSQLQFLISARHIEDMNSFIESLKPFKGIPVTVKSYATDAEGYIMCDSIWNAMHTAEMDATNECGRFMGVGRAETGINVYGPDFATSDAIGTLISHAAKTGVAVAPADSKGRLAVFIGIRQPFWLGGQVAPAPSTKSRHKPKTAKHSPE